jgi:hypothetical protein
LKRRWDSSFSKFMSMVTLELILTPTVGGNDVPAKLHQPQRSYTTV